MLGVIIITAIGYLFGGLTGTVIGLIIAGLAYAWFNWINPDYS